MRYSKKHVNEIIDQILHAVEATHLGAENNHHLQNEIELIKEENLLIDRRKSALPEYASEILFDFMELKFSYKDLMNKYHCSFRMLRTVLYDCAKNDDRVYEEMEIRRK